MYPLDNVWINCLKNLNVTSMSPLDKCPLAPSVGVRTAVEMVFGREVAVERRNTMRGCSGVPPYQSVKFPLSVITFVRSKTVAVPEIPTVPRTGRNTAKVGSRGWRKAGTE